MRGGDREESMLWGGAERRRGGGEWSAAVARGFPPVPVHDFFHGSAFGLRPAALCGIAQGQQSHGQRVIRQPEQSPELVFVPGVQHRQARPDAEGPGSEDQLLHRPVDGGTSRGLLAR